MADLSDTLATAVATSFAARYDTTKQAVTQMIQVEVEKTRDELDKSRIDTVQRLNRLISEADSNTDATVIDCYRRMLERYNARI